MPKMFIKQIEGHSFDFTRTWFQTRNLLTFQNFILPVWGGKPLVYLEVGVFEGMSLVWMLEYVLTHAKSRAVGIDPWLMTVKLDESYMDGVKDRAFYNMNPWSYIVDEKQQLQKCQLIRGNSSEVLRKMQWREWGFVGIQKETVDVCMIDGDHNALGVLSDAQFCFQLVKPGGWMLFDDVENDKKHVDHVKEGLDLFLQKEKGVRFLWKDRYMVAYEKSE